MSHLSTIISRVEHRLKVNPDDLKNDNLFLQSVCNLKEYQQAWDNFTAEEAIKAIALYEDYKHLLIGTIYEDIL
ncbi:hypothetical protein LCGC14_2694140 [marine sediment metagenome]|uniref:Uncharacterized protein n=1 Tax=marine sediment metagenome TaxID=412755 RepID=A0A0F8ZHQ1_9ZZZZ